MHEYTAKIAWSRRGAKFTDGRYSRAHEWSFDGGINVPASSSPLSVPPPFSKVEAVDPEEALVASASSCHMLWFLSLAARRGFVVEEYLDRAVGVMEADAEGKLAITRIVLRPEISFAEGKAPEAEVLHSLHEAAHGECYIARSLRAAIRIQEA